MTDKNIEAFLALVKAGLWEKEVRLSQFDPIDINGIYRLAQEQAVVGLVAAGLEHVVDIKVSKEDLLFFVGSALQLEQRNLAMNSFIESLVEKMRRSEVYTILVKGQGIAQCYERPLWRACGDVDLLFIETDYEKAKQLIKRIATSEEHEEKGRKHYGFIIDSWSVEIHGALHCSLSRRIDRVIDAVQNEVFCRGDVRSWMNGKTQVFLPGKDSDAVFIFTHFLRHFYKEGLGLRQICDWCRLLWTYRDDINLRLLESRLKKMGLTSEWKAFGTFTVEYLGMPAEAMPFYSSEESWKKKAEKIFSFIMIVGNMGHNRDSSFFSNKPYLVRKVLFLGRRCGDLYRHASIFPLDSLRFFPSIVFNGVRSAVRGE